MSEIIDTGLGWWANEDWLKQGTGLIGSIASGASNIKEVPIFTTAPSYAALVDANYLAYTSSTDGDVYMGVVFYGSYTGTSCRLFACPGNPGTGIGVMCLPAGSGRIGITIYVTKAGGTVDFVVSGQTSQIYGYDQYYRLGWFQTTSAALANVTSYHDMPYFNGTIDQIFSSLIPGSAASFYKLASGYAVTCIMRWINANQEELVAPILVSTDTNYIPISTDGSTPAPGIVTGIDYAGTMFYVNILLGYTGTVSSSVPYQDITGIYPQGTNIDGLFRAIVTLAQIRFDDPYANGGTSGPGGGDGTFDFSSTDIPVPGLPSIGAYNAGFISLYRPSAGELGSLASYMWSSAFDIANFIKIFANPMDCILGLHIIPTAGGHPYSSAATLKVGNISTGLSMPRLTEQYFELDCGTIQVQPKWGAYLDYSPYSKLSLFLPYIGFVTISPDDCMGGSIRVVYHVDVLSGSVCVYVYCSSSRLPAGHTLYTYTGSCACDCPVTEGQYTNGLFGSIKGGVGLAAGMLTGNVMGGLEDAANALVSMVKPEISRSGSFGGSAGLMGIQYPYLVLTVPRMCTPGQQNKYVGYPSFVTTPLSSVTGYAQVDVTHLEGMSATDEEVTELLGLLAEGVIF